MLVGLNLNESRFGKVTLRKLDEGLLVRFDLVLQELVLEFEPFKLAHNLIQLRLIFITILIELWGHLLFLSRRHAYNRDLFLRIPGN